MFVRKRHCWTYLLLAAAAATLLPTRTAHAAAYTYSSRQRTINAGILLLDDKDVNGVTTSGMGVGDFNPTPAQVPMGADDPDPYVFYILNQRADVKPLGWNIVNPLAPPTVTGDIQLRWDARTGVAPGAHAYALNQAVTPSMAAYWEVSLSRDTVDDLSQFDVLLLNLKNHRVRLTMSETEKLRRFVDGGGQLWVEDSGNGNILDVIPTGPPATPYLYGPLFADVMFNNGTAAGQAVLPPLAGTLLRQPIIDTPYLLSNYELQGLGTNPIQSTIIGTDPTTTLPDLSLLSTVVGNSSPTAPVISAGQLGAGQIIVTTTGSSRAINEAVGTYDPGFGPNSGPFCGNNFAAAPIADLKFVSDIISWDTAHPTEHKTSHQSSQSRSSLGPAVAPLWNYPVPAPTGATSPPTFTPGAALEGDYAYVRDVRGVLRAFNTQPGTDILGSGTPDAGVQDFTKGYSYDEIWDSAGNAAKGITPISLTDPFASAPTVANVQTASGSQLLVFIEGSDGTVYAADAITGAPAGTAGISGGKLPGSGSGGGAAYTTLPAPAPTFYNGYVFAGQPNGSLYVFSFVPSTATGGVQYPVVPSGSTEQVIAPPSVGVIRENITGTAVDDIVAAVTTSLGVYTVHVGSRHDRLLPNNTLRPASQLTPAPLPVDTKAAGRSYQDARVLGGSDAGYPLVLSAPTGMMVYPPPMSAPPTYPTESEYADYNSDFTNNGTPNGSVLNRIEFTANPTYLAAAGSGYTPKPAVISAPALDARGFYYYTVNLPTSQPPLPAGAGPDSTLVCAHDARQNPNPGSRIFWRFRLPYANETSLTGGAIVDADGINYNPLRGFQFTGAPVTDSQGNVFALAVNNNVNPPVAAVLCLNGRQSVSVAAVPAGQVAPNTVTVQTMTQPISLPGAGGSVDEFGGPPQGITGNAQFSGNPDVNGNITISNFGGVSGGSLSPNLSEPESVTVSYTTTTGAGAVSTVNPAAGLHTNMAWYALLPVQSVVSPLTPGGAGYSVAGLTMVGSYLFFGDSRGNVYRLYAYPQDSGLVGPNRSVNVGTPIAPSKDNNGRPIFDRVATNAGSINGVLSAGSDAMIVNGDQGVVALGSRYTLVADNNRILEVDSDGLASWAVDSTSGPAPNGTVTHLDLNHPASVFQLAPNDYLVADTGNNRCVRFDRSGSAVWELTRFNDYTDPTTAGLFQKTVNRLVPGEPTTLNHPTSVQSYRTYVKDNVNGGLATVVHYLISDTGNFRVLEVVDVFDGLGRPLGPQHNLVWLTHTYDRQGRRYRYTSASYFAGPPDANGSVKQYVAALVSNARIATPLPAATTPASGQLNAASADAPGSSLVLLDYDPLNAFGTTGFGSNGQADGYVAAANSTYYVYLTPGGRFDINAAPKLTSQLDASGNPIRQSATGSGGPTQLFLRNPRFLETYTPPGGAGPLQNFLLADDNGVYDLFLNTSVTPHRFEAQWGLTQRDYQTLRELGTLNGAPALIPAPVDASLNLYRAALRFSPNSIQRIGTEQVADTSSPSGYYLMGHYIVTNGYSQGQVTPISGFGGESLELNDIGNNIVNPASSNGLVTQDYASFSKPLNTEPLSQPAFALREK